MEGGVPVVIFAPWLKSTFLAWSLYSFLSLLLSHVKHLAFFEREGGRERRKIHAAIFSCSHISTAVPIQLIELNSILVRRLKPSRATAV